MAVKQEVTQEMIDEFMNGHDPMERIVNLEYHYQDDFMRVYYRDEDDVKHAIADSFYPFLWATKKACRRLCGGDKAQIRKYLLEYGICCTGLDTTNTKGEVVKEMENGYTVMFKAMRPMSYSRFLDFFKRCGNPVYSDRKDKSAPGSIYNQTPEEKERSKQYLVVTPKEQYLIATGKRYFKGYDDYNGCLRMIFDLETTGLDTRKDRIEQFGIWFNRPVLYKGRKIEFRKIYDVSGETKEELDASEMKNIRNFLSIIYTFKPDIITAHNGESFDWNIIIGACERLGTTLEAVSAEYFGGESIRKGKKESILKLGGEIEKFNKTIVPGCIVTDSLHAVRRAQAMDSNMQEANLKYVTKYAGLEKKDRVYVPGESISTIYNDYEERYAFNDEDGDWYLYNPDYLSDVSKDDDNKRGKDSLPFTLYTRNYIKDGYHLVTGHYVVQRYLLDDLYECDRVEYRFNTTNFFICKVLPIPYEKCCIMGTAGQWKGLMMAWSYENNLAIPMSEPTKSFTGGLSRLLRTGYVNREIKLDYNSLYPSITLTWAISTWKDISGVMLKMLNYVLTKREGYKAVKKKYGKMVEHYEELLNQGVVLNNEQKDEYQVAQSEYIANDFKQTQQKQLGNSFFGSYGNCNVFNWGDLDCAERITCTGRQSLRLMIGHFSNIGNNNGIGEDYNYTPIVGDTDGFNFQLPNKYRYTEEHPYISSGLSRETKEGKAYTEFEGDLAEFNDVYMQDFHYAPNAIQRMGLGLDEIITGGSIQLGRKNYIDYFPEKPVGKDLKLVGNTMKSKKMPLYIKNFIDNTIRLLLNKKGKEFIEEYYKYIERIYNYQIPLRQIASKGKIKKTLKEYVEDCKTITKAGTTKARQSWMELALKHNLDVHLGETLYYINTGTSKSHADVKKVIHYYQMENGLMGLEKKDCKVKVEKEYKTAPDGKNAKLPIREWVAKHYPDIIIEDEIVLNCELVPREIIDSEKEFYCEEGKEYNVPKYIKQFNDRIKALLVCFKRDVRDKILVMNPKDRGYFTNEECELIGGEPNSPGDQDTYEALMTMDDREIRFWMSHPEWEIPFLKETGMDWDKIVKDYNERMEKEKELGINKVREAFEKAMDKMSNDEYMDLVGELVLPSCMSSFVTLDKDTGKILSKDYPDIAIATVSDVIDYRYQKDLIGNNEDDAQEIGTE